MLYLGHLIIVQIESLKLPAGGQIVDVLQRDKLIIHEAQVLQVYKTIPDIQNP